MIALLAYPRSGSSFTTYLLCLATKTRTLSIGNPVCPMVSNELIPPYEKAGLTKFHYPVDCGWAIGEKYDKLILLHRDPIENVLSWLYSSQNRKDSDKSPEPIPDFCNRVCDSPEIEQEIAQFKRNVDFYHNFAGKKVIIKYENITSHPARELSMISDFIGAKQSTINDIKAWSQFHKDKMLTHKDDMFRLNTKGVDNHKFTKSLMPENLAMLKSKLQGYFYEHLYV